MAEDGACALSAGGVASCWGDDSPEGSYPPRPLAGLEGGLTAISVNTTASCAVTANGGVDCWGYGSVGQLAGASPARSSGDPVPVAGFACTPSGVTGVGAGPGSLVASTCADPLTFADPDVESVVRGAIGLATGPILNANVADLTDLNLIFSDRPNLPPTPPYTSPPTDIDYVDPPKADGIVTSLGGVECLSNLRTIDLDPYLVDLTPLGRLANLTELDFTQTFETAFPPLPSATSLTASLLYNTAAGLSACPNLRVLNLTSPDFSTAGARSSLAALTGLTTLSLQGGNLTDTAPLASLPLLTDVELASNQIQDISSLSAGFANLRSLDLSDNPITDLAPLVANGNLGYGAAIAITGVSIDCTAQGPNIAALRARGVTLVTDCP